jgi:hypothetical protein
MANLINLHGVGYSCLPSKEFEGFRIVVNTRGERGHKPHVHVIRGRGRCKITLDVSLTPYDAVRMPARDVKRARELVREHITHFAGLWEKYNG